ncbi:tyrosine-type recombinase/integrase [Saccharopolyspora kobensis]|nr:site-specific integrase [Saccharopolyspora kobensis]
MKGRENAAKPYRAEWYDFFSKPGKRKIGGTKTFATLREGNRWWQDMERENAAYFRGETRVRSCKFGAFATAWADDLAYSENTNKSYRSNVRALIKHFGEETPVAAITAADVRAMKADLKRRGRSDGTIRVRLVVLNKLMQAAIVEGLRSDDPTQGVERPAEVRHRARIVTLDEILQVVEKLDERLRAPVLLAWYTGLRIGEVCGLHIENLNLDRARLQIVQIMFQDGTERVGAKNGRDDQWVGLAAQIVEVLREHLRKFPPLPSGHIFSYVGRDGSLKPLGQAYLRRHFRKACEAAGLSGRMPKFHELRHSCATYLAENEASAYAIKALLRHSRLDTSQRYIDELEVDQLLETLDRVHGAQSGEPAEPAELAESAELVAA